MNEKLLTLHPLVIGNVDLVIDIMVRHSFDSFRLAVQNQEAQRSFICNSVASHVATIILPPS